MTGWNMPPGVNERDIPGNEADAPRHASITLERVEEAVRRYHSSLDNPGFCTACGNEQGGCEPDAREIECEACGEPSVYGADELFVEMAT